MLTYGTLNSRKVTTGHQLPAMASMLLSYTAARASTPGSVFRVKV